MPGGVNNSTSNSGSAPINGPLSMAGLKATAEKAAKKATEILISLSENEINALKYTMPGGDLAAALIRNQRSQAIAAGQSAAADTTRQAIQGLAGLAGQLGPVFDQIAKKAGQERNQEGGGPGQEPQPPRQQSNLFANLSDGIGGLFG